MQNKTIGELLSNEPGRLAVAYIRQAVERLEPMEQCDIIGDIQLKENKHIDPGAITENVFPILGELDNIVTELALPTKGDAGA